VIEITVALSIAPFFPQPGEIPLPINHPLLKWVMFGISISFCFLAARLLLAFISKVNSETRKNDQEIQRLENSPDQEHAAVRATAVPWALGQRVSLIVLRYVILKLTLIIWSFVPALFGYAMTLAVYCAMASMVLSGSTFEPSDLQMLVAIVGSALLAVPFKVVYWMIVLGFGWPILRDACSVLNIPIRGFFSLPRIAKTSS
jgi:hypothetical protein